MVVDAQMLQVKLLGYPTVHWNSERLKLPTQKLQAILYFLAVNRQASREELAELLWESDAKHRLRPELHRLKNLAGADSWLNLDATATVAFDTDLTRFETLVRQEKFAEALALHPEKAYLIQGFSLEDAPQFMDWLSLERERVAELYREALMERAEEFTKLEQHSEALELVRLLIQLDPLDESAYRFAMRLEYARGHIQAALRQFETCRRVLAEEFGMEPLEETLALAREIERGKALPDFAIAEQIRLPPQLLRPPSLIARETEWARMEAAFQAGQIIFISGHAGLGKTRLMLDFATSKGDFVLAEGRIGDKNIPFSSQSRLLQNYFEVFPEKLPEPWVMQELSRFLTNEPGEVFMPDEATKQRLQQAMVAFFNHSGTHLNVFPTDNLQYFDALSNELSSKAAAEFFAQSIAKSDLRCAINTFRTGEVSAEFEGMLGYFLSQGLAIHIELDPLDVEAIKNLLGSLKLNTSDELAERLFKLTSGNPQFIIETLKSLYLTGQLETLPEKLPLPEKLSFILGKRLDTLSTLASRIAKAVATLELSLSNERLADVLELNAFDIAEGIAELEEAQVFSGNQFVHDILQETAKQKTPLAVQRHLHKRTAELLMRDKPLASRIAHHFLAADERDKALPWRLKAIEEAIENGFLTEASAWLEELIFEAPEDSKTYAQALNFKGRILLQKDIVQAETCFEEALELSKYLHTDAEVAALEGLVQCARLRRDFESVVTWLGEALKLPLEAKQRARLHYHQAVASALTGHSEDAEKAFLQAIQNDPERFEHHLSFATFCWYRGRIRENADLLLGLIRRFPTKAKTTLLYHNLGAAFWALGETDNAFEWLGESLELWQDSANLQNEAMTYLGLGTVQVSAGHYAEALASFEKAEQLFTRLGSESRAADARSRIAYVYYLGGQFKQALESSQTAIPVLKEQAEPFLFSYALSFLAATQIRLNDFSEARVAVDEAISIAERNQHPLGLLMALPRKAELALHMNDPITARETNETLIEIAETTEVLESNARALLFGTRLTEDASKAKHLAQQALELAEARSWTHIAFEATTVLCYLGHQEDFEAKRLHYLTLLQEHSPDGWFTKNSA